MPLPASSKPNETTRIALHPRQSALPKHALVFKLNSEALNALDSFTGQPDVDIDLNNDNPGLYIGNTFFPLRLERENISHELYIRAATANKPNAPLRCHANVVGKLSLTDRELDPALEERIKEKTRNAREQRDVPKTKYLETPPTLAPITGTTKTSRKKDTTSMWRKPVKPSDQPRASASGTSTPATRPTHHHSSSQSSAETLGFRKQIIHHLARTEHEDPSLEDILRAIGTDDHDPVVRRKITDIVEDVAEQLASKRWTLKTNSWKEVRPYEWHGLSDTERTQVARKGRLFLSKLGIGEGDELWSHFKTRIVSQSAPPKRGISSQDVKEKKPARAPVKIEFPAKDDPRTTKLDPRNPLNSTHPPTKQTQQPPPASGSSKKAPPPPPIVASTSSSSSARPSPTARKLPGSGFKLNKTGDSSHRRSESLSQDGSPAPTAPSYAYVKPDPGRPSEQVASQANSNVRSRADAVEGPPPKRVKRLKEEAGVESERELDPRRDRDRNRNRERERDRDQRDRDRERETTRERGRDRDREREREQRERERQHERQREREKDMVDERRRERGQERERERDPRTKAEPRDDMERVRDKKRAQPTQDASNRTSDANGSLKRKKQHLREDGEETEDYRDGNKSLNKRQRTSSAEDDYPAVSSRDRPHKLPKPPVTKPPHLTSTLPKKPVLDTPPPRLQVKQEKIKKEPSPLPQISKIKKEPSPMPPIRSSNVKKEQSPVPSRLSSSASRQSSASKTTSKQKRKSPIYTSSEDEGDGGGNDTSAASSSSRNHNVLPTPPMSTPTTSHFPSSSRSSRTAAPSTSSTPAASTSNGNSTSPSDHAGLRARYSSQYVNYLNKFTTAMAQKSKIENLLSNLGEGSVGSLTDSEGDVELMDYDRLSQVVGDTKRMWEELQGMQQAFESAS